MINDTNITIGDNIRNYRKKAGLTQKKLGELSGTSETTIKQYELKKRQPRLEQLRKIAAALGTTIGELVGGSTEGWREAIADSNPWENPKEELSFDELGLLQDYRFLNNVGKGEAKKRVNELTEIPKYRKDTD